MKVRAPLQIQPETLPRILGETDLAGGTAVPQSGQRLPRQQPPDSSKWLEKSATPPATSAATIGQLLTQNSATPCSAHQSESGSPHASSGLCR